MTARNRLAEAFARMNASRDHDEIIRARGDVFDAVAAVLAEQAAPPPALALPEALVEVRRRLLADRKKNDHFTADPIYTVQRETRIYGLDPDYAEHFAWIEDSEVCASDLSERLERRFNRGWTIPDRYRRVGYCTQWVFVDAYLSYDAAKERVEYESRKRNGNYRTYVESGCRNHEWKALQAWLLSLAAPQPQPQAVSIRVGDNESTSFAVVDGCVIIPTGDFLAMADVLRAAPQPQAEPVGEVDGITSSVKNGATYVKLRGELPAGTKLYAAQQPQASAEDVARLTHERNILGQAIAEMAVKLGIANGEAPIAGPMLLMLCEDVATVFAGKKEPQASAEDVRAVAACMRSRNAEWVTQYRAWMRIEADYERMGVVK